MLSVITPSYNIIKDEREEFFHRMMKSVHSQTYEPIEHIVVDDGSEDGSLEILQEYKEKGWIDTLVKKEHEGIYPTMNRGLRRADGDYINIMNTDDFLTKSNFFEKSVRKIQKTEVDFTHADRVITPRGDGPAYIKRGDEKVAFFRMPFRQQTMVFKSDIFKDVGLFDQKYQLASDYKHILDMLLHGKRGFHFSEIAVNSLGGGISSKKKLAQKEVPKVLYEVYGNEYGLTKEDCRDIYQQKKYPSLFLKITLRVKDNRIRNSLLHMFNLFREKILVQK